MSYTDLLESSWQDFRDGALPSGIKDLGEDELESVKWVFWAGMFEISRLIFADSDTLYIRELMNTLREMLEDVAAQRMKYQFSGAAVLKKTKVKRKKPTEPCTFAHDLGVKTNIDLEYE